MSGWRKMTFFQSFLINFYGDTNKKEKKNQQQQDGINMNYIMNCNVMK